MISNKMTELVQNNNVIRAMFEEGNRLAAEYGRENVFDFSLGNPNMPAPDAVNKTIIELASTLDSPALHGYMSNIGYSDVRADIAESLNTNYKTEYSENNIIMSVGAAGGLNVVLKTLLNPGDEVIAVSPYFVEYNNYVNNYQGKLIAVPACRDDFRPDTDALEKAITKETKALILNSPNNPTGVVYSQDVLKSISAVLESCSKKFGAPIYIISDEPYRELAYDDVEVPWVPHFYKNTIVCYSWSKSLSLPGQRIGYIVIPGGADDYELIFDAAGIATRILGFVNAPALIQRVVQKCLNEQVNIAAYDTNRKLLYNCLTSLGFETVYPQGAFYLWVKTPVDDKKFAEQAKHYNILLVPGSAFACPGYARIAYCVSKQSIERSLPAFEKLAGDYRG